MAYKKYTVEQGDGISSIAFKYGFFPDTIWNDSKNSKLKQDRKDPNVLKPGDEVYVRDKEEKEESCASEKKHRFKRKGVPAKLRLQFKLDGEPRANQPCVLEIDGMLSERTTDDQGKLEAWIAPNAKKGKVMFREVGDEYQLKLGHLDPITELSGVQGRLQNLGFYDGTVDGKMTEQFQKAISNFQKAHKLDPTGTLDQATRDMIDQDARS